MITPDPSIPCPEAAGKLRAVLDRRLLQTVFQPIVDLCSGEVAGHEVLTRPLPESGFQNADQLFCASEHFGMNNEIESLSRRLAIEAAGTWRAGSLLFMNSSPEVIANLQFAHDLTRELRANGKLTPTRIVLEITERCRDREFSTLPQSIEMLRESGFQVAIDDVGAGTSGLNRIMTLRPGWLKLDRELVDGIHEDKIRQHMVQFLVYFGRLSAIRVVGEGIESIEELDALIDLGVSFGQGYLLGRPGQPVGRIDPELARHIVARARTRARAEAPLQKRGLARMMARPAPTCESTAPVCEVATMLLHDLAHPGCIVVDGGRFTGWCDRDRVLRAASDGRASLPVSFLVGSNRISIEASTPLVEALELAASRNEHHMGSPIVVVDDDHVVGIIPMSDLLKAACDACRSLQSPSGSPTGLPGRVRTDMHLSEMLQHTPSGRSYDVAFIELRGFAGYNHRYGYDLGDQLIQQLIAQMRVVLLHEIDDSFIGHLGDDRFVVTAPHGALDANLARFLSEFEQRASHASAEPGTTEHSPELGIRVLILEDPIPTCQRAQDLFGFRSELRLQLDRDDCQAETNGPSQVFRRSASALQIQRQIRQSA